MFSLPNLDKSPYAKLQIVVAFLTIMAAIFNKEEPLEVNEIITLVVYNIFSVYGTACVEKECPPIALIRICEPMLALLYILKR